MRQITPTDATVFSHIGASGKFGRNFRGVGSELCALPLKVVRLASAVGGGLSSCRVRRRFALPIGAPSWSLCRSAVIPLNFAVVRHSRSAPLIIPPRAQTPRRSGKTSREAHITSRSLPRMCPAPCFLASVRRLAYREYKDIPPSAKTLLRPKFRAVAKAKEIRLGGEAVSMQVKLRCLTRLAQS